MSLIHEHPFLESILARHHDDGPRLIYADYLDETGNSRDAARAELIRVQIALARLPFDHPRRAELENRQAELVLQNEPVWTDLLAGLVTSVEFRRGLPELVVIDAATFLAHGDELFRRTRIGPSIGRSLVRGVRLRDPARVLPRLIACPFLAELQELDLCQGDLGNGGVNLLVRSPHLGGIRTLDLGFNGLDDAGTRILAQAAALTGLRTLKLNDNGHITWDGVRALTESSFFTGLTELDLSGNVINDAGVRAVADSPAMVRLYSLAIDRNHIGDLGVAVLVGSAMFRRMLVRNPHLNLQSNAIGPVGVEALAGCPDLARVTGLDLDKNYLGDRGVVSLTRSGRLSALRSLRLSRNQLADPAAFTLSAALAEMPKLRSLDVSGNRLTWRGVGALRAVAIPRGISLVVSGNGIDPVVPVAVSELVAGILQEVAEIEVAALRRRVSHPVHRDS